MGQSELKVQIGHTTNECTEQDEYCATNQRDDGPRDMRGYEVWKRHASSEWMQYLSAESDRAADKGVRVAGDSFVPPAAVRCPNSSSPNRRMPRFKGFRVNVDAYRQAFRNVKACRANPVVGHPVVDVETVRGTKIVPAVNASGKHDVGNGSVPLLW